MMKRDFTGAVFFIIFALLCITAFSAVTGNAENTGEGDPKYIFYKASTFYEKGEYGNAVNEYSKLLSAGYESGNLYYNLGNSYFKKGELGRAVLYYEKAKRLMPRDSDLESNYGFALSRVKYNVSETAAPWYKRAFRVFNALTINEMTVMVSALFAGIVLFLIVRLYVPVSHRVTVLFIAASITVLAVAVLSLFSRISMLDREAITVTESTEARFEPFESGTTHFTLYEGMKVEILQSGSDWLKVRRPDGKAGWIRGRDVEKI